MKKYTVCAMHHEVLLPWAELRCRSDVPLRVLTLDFHTDTMPCFRHAEAPPESGVYVDRAKVAEAVKKLRHDEHFDWALHAGVIARGDILACSPPPQAPEHPDLAVYVPPEFPEIEVMLNQPERFRKMAAQVLESSFLQRVLGAALPEPGERFILDIDCDYFMCSQALTPADGELFARLMRQAEVVTFSCENDWVKLLKLPGENITGESIASTLIERFLI